MFSNRLVTVIYITELILELFTKLLLHPHMFKELSFHLICLFPYKNDDDGQLILQLYTCWFVSIRV